MIIYTHYISGDNMNIRNYIINNFKDCSEIDIKQSIISSIDEQDEITLPGLGVLFEILWNNSKEEEKEKYIKTLKKGL